MLRVEYPIMIQWFLLKWFLSTRDQRIIYRGFCTILFLAVNCVVNVNPFLAVDWGICTILFLAVDWGFCINLSLLLALLTSVMDVFPMVAALQFLPIIDTIGARLLAGRNPGRVMGKNATAEGT